MKTPRPGKMRRTLPLVLLLTGIILTIFFYNLWSYGCGHCTRQTLLTLGLPEYVSLGLIAAALASWVLLMLRRRIKLARYRCRCGSMLQEHWRFCPDCGVQKA